MKSIAVGSVSVSRLILGTDYFGTGVDETLSFELMDEYFASGGRALDTARLYASWLSNGGGASERTIGKWLSARGRREKMCIITKGGARDKGEPGAGRLSRQELCDDLSRSLEALRIPCADIYFLHRDDTSRPVGDIMETMAAFIADGKIRVAGCSNWRAERISAANAYADTHGLPRFMVSELQWSLAASTPELHKDESIVCMNDAEYSFYLESKLPVFAFSSQAKGYFSRASSGGIDSNNKKALERFNTPQNRARLERLKELMGKYQITASAVTLGYITSNRVNACAIIGPKNIAQLTDSLTAAEHEFTPEDIAYLES